MGWNPIVSQEIVCTMLPPFNYQPPAGLYYLNRAGLSNKEELKAMANEVRGQSNDQFYQDMLVTSMMNIAKKG